MSLLSAQISLLSAGPESTIQGVGGPHHSALFCLSFWQRQWQPPSLVNNDANSHTGAKHQLFTENHDFPGFRGGLVTPGRLSSLSFLGLNYFHTIPDKNAIKISFIVKGVKFERTEYSCALQPVAGGIKLYLN